MGIKNQRRRPGGFSLTFRLSLFITLLITFLLGAVGVYTYVHSSDMLIEETVSRGWSIGNTVSAFAVDHMREKNYLLMLELIKNLEKDGFIREATVVDADGRIVAHTGDRSIGEVVNSGPVIDVMRTGQRKLQSIKDDSGKVTAFSFTLPIADAFGKVYGYFYLVVDFSLAQYYLQQTAYNILGLFVIASLAGLLFTRMIILKSVHRPVQELLKSTERISVGDFSGKLEVLTRDELGRLAGAFNAMNDHLGKLFATIRSTVSEMGQTSALIARQSDPDFVKGGGDNIDGARQKQVLKEINSSARRLHRLSDKLNSLALQFKTESSEG